MNPTENHPTPKIQPRSAADRDQEAERAIEWLRRPVPDETPEKKAGRLLFLATISPWRSDLETWFEHASGMKEAVDLWQRTSLELVPQAATLAVLDPDGLEDAHAVLLALPAAAGRDVPGTGEVKETAKSDLDGVWSRLGARVEASERARAERFGDFYDRAAACFLGSRRCLAGLAADAAERPRVTRVVHALGVLALVPRLEERDLAVLEPARLLDLLDAAPRPTPHDAIAVAVLAGRVDPAAEELLARAAGRPDEHRALQHVVLGLLCEKPDDRALDFLFDTLAEHKRCDFGVRATQAITRVGATAARRFAERFDALHEDLPDAAGMVQALAHSSLLEPVKRAFEVTRQIGYGEALERLYRLDDVRERPEPDLASRLEEIRAESPEAILTSLDLGLGRSPKKARVHLVCHGCGRSFVQDLLRLYVLSPMIGNLVEDFFYPEDIACPWCHRIGGHPIDPNHLDRLQKYFEILRRLDESGADLSATPFRFVHIAPPGEGQAQPKSALGALWTAGQRFHSPGSEPAAGIVYARLLARIGEPTRASAIVDQALARGRLDPRQLLASAEVLRELGQSARAEEIERQLRVRERPRTFEGVGRNDPCPCGSGKKYKKCCLKV